MNQKTLTLVTSDNGATTEQLQAGNEILKKVPGLKKAFEDYVGIATKANAKFWQLCDLFRKPVEIAKGASKTLDGAEVTNAMLALGANKARAAEMKALCGLGIGEYEFIREHAMSKDDALKIARGSVKLIAGPDGKLQLPAPVAPPAAGTPPPPPPAGTPPPPPPAETYHKCHDTFRARFHDLMQLEIAPKPTDDDVNYTFNGETADGKKYLVRIFVDSVPVGAAK